MRSQCFRDSESRELQETGEATLIREVKPQPREVRQGFDMGVEGSWLWERCGYECYPSCAVDGITPIQCPFTMGEQSWVRETWATNWKEQTITRAEWDILYDMLSLPTSVSADTVDWKPAVTMPRWASRATVEVVESDVFQDGGVWYWRARERRVE